MAQMPICHSGGWRRLAASSATLALFLLSSGGCPLLPTGVFGAVADAGGDSGSTVLASVTATDETTGMPTALSGTVSGQIVGEYDEELLEIFFDADGVPIAAISRSEITVTSPAPGTLITINLIIVHDLILLTDDDGAPVLDSEGAPTVIGLVSAANGEMIHATGVFAGFSGDLHADSELFFTGGDFDLGYVDSDIVVTLGSSAAQ